MSKWLEQQEKREREMEENRRAIELLNEATKDAPVSDNDSTYTLTEGDTIWRVAQRLGYTVQELADHNDIPREKWEAVHMDNPAYSTLHLPHPKESYKTPEARIEPLIRPLRMHVNKEDGVKKYAFGNPESIITSGNRQPYQKNVIITAIAHVPQGEDETRYYMDALAFGNYSYTGRVASTVGFLEDDLSDGHVSTEKPVQRPELAEKLAQVEQEMAVMQTIADMEIQEIQAPEVELDEAQLIADNYADTWQDTKKNIRPDGEPVEYEALEDLWVKDLNNPIDPGKRFASGRKIMLDFTVMKDDDYYGVPAKYTEHGVWYGFPLNKMMTKYIEHGFDVDEYLDEAYNEEVDLQSRLALHGRVSTTERYITVPLAKALNTPFIRKRLDKLKHK